MAKITITPKNNIENKILHHVGQVICHGQAIFAWQSGLNKIANKIKQQDEMASQIIEA